MCIDVQWIIALFTLLLFYQTKTELISINGLPYFRKFFKQALSHIWKESFRYSSFFRSVFFFNKSFRFSFFSTFNKLDDSRFSFGGGRNLLNHFFKKITVQTPMARCYSNIIRCYHSRFCFSYILFSYSKKPCFRCYSTID